MIIGNILSLINYLDTRPSLPIHGMNYEGRKSSEEESRRIIKTAAKLTIMECKVITLIAALVLLMK